MTLDPLGEVGANFSLQLSSREHSLLKSIIKKLSPKINVKNIKKSSLINIKFHLEHHLGIGKAALGFWPIWIRTFRRMAENGFAPPPLGNFADISYLVEN